MCLPGHAANRHFQFSISPHHAPVSLPQSWGERARVAGLLARMVVFVLIGIFLVKAAYDYSPCEAIGFDGAVQKLVNHSYGSWLRGIVAAGLLAYAVFCLFEARTARSDRTTR